MENLPRIAFCRARCQQARAHSGRKGPHHICDLLQVLLTLLAYATCGRPVVDAPAHRQQQRTRPASAMNTSDVTSLEDISCQINARLAAPTGPAGQQDFCHCLCVQGSAPPIAATTMKEGPSGFLSKQVQTTFKQIKDHRDGETTASVPGPHLRILRRCSRVRPGASGSCSHSSCLVRGFLAAALRLALRPSSPSMSAHRRTAFETTLTSPKFLSTSLSNLGTRYAPAASLSDPWHAPGNNSNSNESCNRLGGEAQIGQSDLESATLQPDGCPMSASLYTLAWPDYCH